jgi:hypothetical protein
MLTCLLTRGQVDIGDDLTDYEDDVVVNSFNIYRGLFAWALGDSCLWNLLYTLMAVAQPALLSPSQPTCTCMGPKPSCCW